MKSLLNSAGRKIFDYQGKDFFSLHDKLSSYIATDPRTPNCRHLSSEEN